MGLAARRDTVAAEYVRGFAVTFDLGLARLRRALGRGLSLLDAIAQAHLELMARVPDTLIARKAGAAAAAAVAARAGAVVRAGGVVTPRGLAAARRLDRDLRRHGNRLNPGTSADLIAAALFVWLLETPARRRLAGATRHGSRAATDGRGPTTGSRGQPQAEGQPAQPAGPTPPPGPNVRDGAARQVMSEFRVRIEKDYTVFCAGHFITYDGHECEPLHGHNYRAAAALEGPLDENAYVFDFTRLKRALRAIVDRLDHRMLLPTKSALIHVTQIGRRGSGGLPRQALRVSRQRRGAPAHLQHHRGDAGVVDRAGAQSRAWERSPPGVTALEVEVDESSGQRAFYRETLGKGADGGTGRP